MERSKHPQKSYIHPSRAHLFQKPPASDNVNHLPAKHVSRTWNNRQDRQNGNEKKNELLVFGYASKLFPPDSQSSAIARNKHLIAWNEDYSLNLLIDRYDCRASLHNLTEFDGDSWNKSYQLSEEESKLEEYLNEERYRALYVEELEEDIRQEEELKRLHASIDENSNQQYGEVGYQYEGEAGEQYDPTEPTEEEDQKIFIAPSSLAIPKEMEIPATVKMHAIIEKTANFVSKQGVQMEIVLKAKQANNSQFQFLQFGHYLNPYYKHVVKRIKEGKYTPGVPPPEDDNQEDSESSDDDGDYLHPSLFAASHKKREEEKQEKTKAIRTIDPDHPLAKLIEKGRQVNAMKQYQKMAEAVYDYYSHQHESTDPKTTLADVEPPPLPSFMSMASVSSSEDVAGNGLLPSHPEVALPPADPSHPAPQLSSTATELVDPPWKMDAHLVPPPPDLQAVVEEVAKKVAIEGVESEKSLVCQADPNYSFLNPWHELHPYYQFRKISWIRMLFPPPPPTDSEPQNSEGSVDESSNVAIEETSDASQEDASKGAAPSAPISFSIKNRKDGSKKILSLAPTSATSMLADGDSDEENEAEEPAEPEEKTEKQVKRKFTDLPADVVSSQAAALPPAPPDQTAGDPAPDSAGFPFIKRTVPPPAPKSSFTAVTPTGESASIADLREKQAARRQRALLFLKAKNKSDAERAEREARNNIKKANSPPSLTAVATEDIFDLSVDASKPTEDEEIPDADETDSKSSISRLDILHKLGSVSRTSSPFSSPGRSKKRSVSRSRSRSRTKESSRQKHSTSRDLPSSYSRSTLIHRELESPLVRSDNDTSSTADEVTGVPSAYRDENIRKRDVARSSKVLKSKRKRSLDLKERRHRKRSPRREEKSSKRSSKHKRSRKRSSSEERKRRKRKKEKRSKKKKRHRAKSRSNSSSEDSMDEGSAIAAKEVNIVEEMEDGEVFPSDDEEYMETESNIENHPTQKSVSAATDVIGEEPSEGEIVSD